MTAYGPSSNPPAERADRKYERLFEDLIAAIEEPERGGEMVWNLAQAAWDDPHYWVAGLSKLLGHQNPRVRAFAATSILRGAPSETAYVVADDLGDRAVEILRKGLGTGDLEERALICGFFVGGGMPTSLVSTIQGFLKDLLLVMRVTAASALAGSGHVDARVKSALLDGLDCEEAGLVTMAAAMLAQVGEQSERSIARLSHLLPNMQDTWLVSALLTLRRLGRAAGGARTALEKLAADSARPSLVRCHALATLGSLGCDPSSAARTLLPYLDDGDTTIALGAIEGLIACGDMPEEAIGPLVRLLDVEDDRVRWVALRGFVALGEKAITAGPVLVARLGREHDEKREMDVAMALSAMGVGVVPLLIEPIKRREVHTYRGVQVALRFMGLEGVQTLLDIVRQDPDARVIAILVNLVEVLGEEADAAVPYLAGLLDSTDDEELATALAFALHRTGIKAMPAVPALLRCVARRCKDAADWAERALWNVGPDALPMFAAEIERADTRGRDRLARVLAGMRPVDKGEYWRYEKFGKEDELRTFLYIAKVLENRGPMPLWAIAVVLSSDDRPAGVPRVQVSERTLGRHLKDVTDALGVEKLTTHRQGRRPGELADHGRRELPKIEAYLAMKAVARGDASGG